VTRIIVDTGPIVAFLNKRDSYHNWAREVFDRFEPPVYSCEAVISEASFLLSGLQSGADGVTEMISRQLIKIEFHLSPEINAVRKLMAKYSNIPMSLADACLVRMTEIDKNTQIVTLDQDFNVYRRSGRQIIPVVIP